MDGCGYQELGPDERPLGDGVCEKTSAHRDQRLVRRRGPGG
ncbi:hypothetical protein [Lentzea guizhouensis]|nr:hypothetical protein [Lentzea guizhouensis]